MTYATCKRASFGILRPLIKQNFCLHLLHCLFILFTLITFVYIEDQKKVSHLDCSIDMAENTLGIKAMTFFTFFWGASM